MLKSSGLSYMFSKYNQLGMGRFLIILLAMAAICGREGARRRALDRSRVRSGLLP